MEQWFAFELGQFHLYALAFLLGSFTVAALSDLKYMSAQREFVEVWLLAAFALLGYDVYLAMDSPDWGIYLAKWVLILVFSLASHKAFGIYFKLARGDVTACAAVAGILTPLLVVIFFIVLKVLDFFMGPFLRVGRKKKSGYPFMPVVLIGTLAITAIAVYAIPWIVEAL